MYDDKTTITNQFIIHISMWDPGQIMIWYRKKTYKKYIYDDSNRIEKLITPLTHILMMHDVYNIKWNYNFPRFVINCHSSL